MAYGFWNLLNICISIALLYCIFRLVKLAYARFGTTGAVIVLLIVLMFPGSSGAKNVATSPKVWDFTTDKDVRYFSQTYNTVLEHCKFFTIDLDVTAVSDKDREVVQQRIAFSSMYGVIGFNRWTPNNIVIKSNGNGFTYAVTGQVDWLLLNTAVYRQQKVYTGHIVGTHPIY